MSIADQITRKLEQHFTLDHLEVLNESDNHNVPPGSESHFRSTIVSEIFEGMKRLDRHRQINGLLADELAGPVHALALHPYSPTEWVARGGRIKESPACLGGGAKDH